jgi:hypothetical protein
MSEESRDPTFRIEKKDQPIYRELTGSNDNGEAIIDTMKAVFLISAAMGVSKNKKIDLSSNTTGPFRWHNLNILEEIPIAKALALAATEDITILTSKEKIRDTLEPYANWGIRELYSELNKPIDKKLLMANLILNDNS